MLIIILAHSHLLPTLVHFVDIFSHITFISFRLTLQGYHEVCHVYMLVTHDLHNFVCSPSSCFSDYIYFAADKSFEILIVS